MAKIRSSEHTEKYTDFKGVDLFNDSSKISNSRLAYSVNMWKDYSSPYKEFLSSVPGYRCVFSFGDGRINGIFGANFKGEDYVIVHVGKKLYSFKKSDRDEISDREGICLISDALEDTRSEAVNFKESLIILDGTNIYDLMLTDNGFEIKSLLDDAYFPTVSKNTEGYMQRNLLTDKFRDRFKGYKKETHNPFFLEYEIYDGDERAVSVKRIKRSRPIVYIPPKVTVDGIEYKIKRVSAEAFKGDTVIEEIVMSENVELVENGAFYGCTSLKTAVLCGARAIGDLAFGECSSLKTLWIGGALKSVYSRSFENTALKNPEGKVFYTSDEEHLSSIERADGGGSFNHADHFTRVYRECVYMTEEVGRRVDTYINVGGCDSGYVVPEYDRGAISSLEPNETWSFFAEKSCAFSHVKLYMGDFSVNIGVTVSENSNVDPGDFVHSFLLPLSGGTREVSEIKINGENISLDRVTLVRNNDFIDSVIIELSDDEIEKSEITVLGTASEEYIKKGGEYHDIVSCTGYKNTLSKAILGCRIGTVFDDRLFLAGNPELPNTVFFCEKQENGRSSQFYFGSRSFVFCGEDEYPIKTMISSPSVITAVKGGKGAVFCIIRDGSSYRISEGVSGIGCVSEGINFFGDSLFVSERGVESFGLKNSSHEKYLEHRSSYIDRELLSSGISLEKSRLAVWEGYLVLLIGDKIYLADSRQPVSEMGYEWFVLDGICAYENDRYVYRYRSTYPSDGKDYKGYALYLKDSEEKVDFDKVRSYEYERIGKVYYTVEDGISYLVDRDGELEGGDRFYASAIYSDGELLFFGCENGALCLFNNDKRGATVKEESVKGAEIHRSFYNRCGHKYISGFSTKSSDCGYMGISKNSVRSSTLIKLRADPGLSLTVKVRSDREPWQICDLIKGGDTSFYAVDFSSATHKASEFINVICRENKRRFTEKQFFIYSDTVNSPFGIYSMSYRWKIAGRVRERDV